MLYLVFYLSLLTYPWPTVNCDESCNDALPLVNTLPRGQAYRNLLAEKKPTHQVLLVFSTIPKSSSIQTASSTAF